MEIKDRYIERIERQIDFAVDKILAPVVIFMLVLLFVVQGAHGILAWMG
jgi:hypothetical protein